MTQIPTVPLTRHLGGFWLPQAAAGTSPPLTPPPRAFRVSASPVATLRPSTRMFLAAFTSASWAAPHCGQVHDLTSRGLLPEQNPHTEHSRLDGNQRLTLTTVACNAVPSPPAAGPVSTSRRRGLTLPASCGPGRTRPGPAHGSPGYRRRCVRPSLWWCFQVSLGDLAMLASNRRAASIPSSWRPVPAVPGPAPCGAPAWGSR